MSGAENMKKEIWQRGPIGCGVDATELFDKYEGGIFRQKLKHPRINHEISVVGWGRDQDSGEEFWVGRNSWGTYWVSSQYIYTTSYLHLHSIYIIIVAFTRHFIFRESMASSGLRCIKTTLE